MDARARGFVRGDGGDRQHRRRQRDPDAGDAGAEPGGDLVAYGDMSTGGDIARAVACGADAVMLGEPLVEAMETPGGGMYWDATVSHPSLPRSAALRLVSPEDRVPLAEVLLGPTADPSGARNLFGGLRRAMAKCGYSNVKEFQRAEITLAYRG